MVVQASRPPYGTFSKPSVRGAAASFAIDSAGLSLFDLLEGDGLRCSLDEGVGYRGSIFLRIRFAPLYQ